MFKAITSFFAKLDSSLAARAAAISPDAVKPQQVKTETSSRLPDAPGVAAASDAPATSPAPAVPASIAPATPASSSTTSSPAPAAAPATAPPLAWTATRQAVATPTGEIIETDEGFVISMAVMNAEGISVYPLHLVGANPQMDEDELMALRVNLVGLVGEGQRSISNADVRAIIAQRRSYHVLIGTHVASGEQRIQQVGMRVQEPA